MFAPAQMLRKSHMGKRYRTNSTSVLSAPQRWNLALQVDVPRQTMQLQGISPHSPPLFCHDAQAATSTSDCTAGTNSDHSPSPHDHLGAGLWVEFAVALLRSICPYFLHQNTGKQGKKLMPPQSHSNKEHLVKFILCDSLHCQRTSLKGRTYTQRGMSNKGTTVLTWMKKGGLTEQPE